MAALFVYLLATTKWFNMESMEIYNPWSIVWWEFIWAIAHISDTYMLAYMYVLYPDLKYLKYMPFYAVTINNWQ